MPRCPSGRASPAYRPIWLGLGALAFDLLLAVLLTSMLRRQFGHRAWRFVHWLAYVSWPVAVVHGLATGTDAKAGWLLALTATCIVAVLIQQNTHIANVLLDITILIKGLGYLPPP